MWKCRIFRLQYVNGRKGNIMRTKKTSLSPGAKKALIGVGIAAVTLLSFALSFFLALYFIVDPFVIVENDPELIAENQRLKSQVQSLEAKVDQLDADDNNESDSQEEKQETKVEEKQEETKEESKKEETKKDESKKDDSKKEETKKDDSEKDDKSEEDDGETTVEVETEPEKFNPETVTSTEEDREAAEEPMPDEL